jgi:hypothetical protein
MRFDYLGSNTRSTEKMTPLDCGRRRRDRSAPGGALIALFGWRTIFLVNIPIGLFGLWLTWRGATETESVANRQIDLPGQLAAVAALGVLSGALIEGGAVGWSNHWVDAGFAAFGLRSDAGSGAAVSNSSVSSPTPAMRCCA